MFFDKIRNIRSLCIVIISLLFWNCSPKFSHDVQSFLFDGVPVLDKVEVSVVKDSILVGDSTSTLMTRRAYDARNDFNLHEPYQKRECSSCHDRNAMGKTKAPTPELCYECHDNFNEIYVVLHGPVAAGNCSECHNPHQSKLKKLLIKKSQDLCLSCHDQALIVTDKIHKEIKEESCTTCHSAHGGNNNYSLLAGSCYECHDNYEKEFKFLHAPVASDNCSQCHSSHKTDKPKLLIGSIDNLCTNCHDSKELNKSEAHKKTGDKNCAECHDPHGGNNENFIFN